MIASLLAVVAGAWLVLLVAAPMLPAELSAVTYAFGSLICHQRPDRSFHLDAFQLPVCARCFGLYAGAALGVWARLAFASARVIGWPDPPRTMTLMALLPTLVTVALEWTGAWQPANLTRALAGVPAGAAVAFVVTGALATVHYGECVPRRPTAPSPPPPSI